MFRSLLSMALIFSIACSVLVAQEDDKVVSGPKAGSFMPAPFECYNVNGPAKGRQHCLICKFALFPSVLIFAKEQPADKDVVLTELIKQLDDAAAEFTEREFSVGVVFLSPDAKDATNNAAEEDAKKIIDETVNREALVARLKDRADKLKHVVVGCLLPEGPKGYALNAKADVTVLFYERLKIQENWAFGAGALDEKGVEAIVKRVRDTLPIKKKKAE